MKKSQKIELQEALINATLESLQALVGEVISGSQESTLKMLAEIGLRTSTTACAIDELSYEDARAAFGLTPDEIVEEGCTSCEGPEEPEDLTEADIRGMIDDVEGMLARLGVNVSR